ncbi:UNVERIFIED_CONTAM: hypothetical protein GTU68_001837 [Idotea baltica]|nr:hypothetical protein [Idotea baltica]
MSSVVGLYGFMERSSYAASKHALQGYFESMQLEGDRPSVTIVSPGRVNTEISKHALNATGDSHGQMDAGQTNGMDANVAARRILRAAAKRKKNLYLGKGEVLMIYFHRYLPILFRTIAKNISAR